MGGMIEPCCCQNQLPKLAEQSISEHRIVAYNTNGDVTIQKLLFAVACLTGNGSTLTLVIPKIDTLTFRYLNQGLERGWWTKLRLLTTMSNTDIKKELPSVKATALQIREDKRISTTSQMLILEGEQKRLVLTGYHPCVAPVDNGQPYRMCQHSLFYTAAASDATSSCTPLWDELTKATLTPFRLLK